MFLRNYKPFKPSSVNLEINFPEEMINSTSACFLIRARKNKKDYILDNITASANNLHLLDEVGIDIMTCYQNYYSSVLIELKFPDNFYSPEDFAKYKVKSHFEILNNFIIDYLPQNCDIKNISKIINSFYTDNSACKNIIIHLIRVDSTGKFELDTYDKIESKYVFSISHNELMDKYNYYLGIFDGSMLLSLSNKIEIDRRYYTYFEERMKREKKRQTFYSVDEDNL
jgi:hypothetical protein